MLGRAERWRVHFPGFCCSRRVPEVGWYLVPGGLVGDVHEAHGGRQFLFAAVDLDDVLVVAVAQVELERQQLLKVQHLHGGRTPKVASRRRHSTFSSSSSSSSAAVGVVQRQRNGVGRREPRRRQQRWRHRRRCWVFFGLVWFVVNGNGKQMSLNWCLSIYDFAFTEFYWVCGPKLAFTEFCRVLPSFYWIHWTFTSFFYLSFPSSFLFFSDGFLFWMKIKMASFDRFRWDAIQISTVFSLSATTSSESRCSAFVHFIGVFSRFCVSSFFLSFSFLFVFFFCFYSPSVGRDDRR